MKNVTKNSAVVNEITLIQGPQLLVGKYTTQYKKNHSGIPANSPKKIIFQVNKLR